MSGLTVTVTPAGNVERALRRVIAELPANLAATMIVLGEAIEADAKAEAPGSMPGSIDNETTPRSVTVGSRWKLAAIVERGRLPGKPPPVSEVGGIASATIGRAGTRPAKTFERTRLRARRSGKVARILSEGAETLGSLS